MPAPVHQLDHAMSLRLALAQVNLVVGDVSGNTQRIIELTARARDELHADLVLFP
jgi:NAD+ synthase (glutamine-hydrolysing)